MKLPAVTASGSPWNQPVRVAAAVPVLVERISGHRVDDAQIRVLPEPAPRRACAADRRPHHRQACVVPGVAVPVAHHAERPLRGRALADDVVADVAVIDRPPRALVIGERQAAGGVVLAADRPPAMQRIGRLDADGVVPVPHRVRRPVEPRQIRAGIDVPVVIGRGVVRVRLADVHRVGVGPGRRAEPMRARGGELFHGHRVAHDLALGRVGRLCERVGGERREHREHGEASSQARAKAHGNLAVVSRGTWGSPREADAHVEAGVCPPGTGQGVPSTHSSLCVCRRRAATAPTGQVEVNGCGNASEKCCAARRKVNRHPRGDGIRRLRRPLPDG